MGSDLYSPGRSVVARLPFGADLLAAVAAVVEEHGVEAGALQGVGALRRARLAFYDQRRQTYEELDFDEPLEIVALLGNVSRRDGDVAVHAHAALARNDGTALGGHVVAGCEVFACELVVVELIGRPLERGHDKQTGLPLWTTL